MARKTATSGPRQVVGYVRVSTDEQALGPEAQRDALSRWCAANGAELVATFEDLGVSGGLELDRRPGLVAALDGLREHSATVLLVAKRDRLARDVMVAAMVSRLAEKTGAQVLSADGTGNGDGPEAQLMRHIVNAFAEATDWPRTVCTSSSSPRSRTLSALCGSCAVKASRFEPSRLGSTRTASWLVGRAGTRPRSRACWNEKPHEATAAYRFAP